MEPMKFEEMNLSPEILRAVYDMGFEEATPIQSRSIDVILSGRDVLGQSQTGTGKTAAFGIPCIEMLNPDIRKLQAVILSPTRELAIQINEEFHKLLKYKDSIRVLPIYGGQPIDRQIQAIKKGVQVIIGTPGRVIDHLERGTLKMDAVRMVVLDEADEMLDMGFREDIETILSRIPQDRQTILFSATMPPAIIELTRLYQQNPELITVVHRELTVPSIDQAFFEVKERTKLEALCRLIDMYSPHLSIVFCNTKKRVDEVAEQLQSRGYFAEGLHGDLKQTQRDVVMKKFRNRTLEVLVATDVAARGIDVDDIEIVFNYDLPQDEEYYVHRIGRTGRAGKSGRAYTFVVGKEIYKLRDIMKYTKVKIPQMKLPTLSDIEEVKSKAFTEKIKATIEEGGLTRYINMVESLLNEDFSSLDVAAALMKLHLFDGDAEDIDFEAESSFNRGYDRAPAKGGRGKKQYNDDGMVRLIINAGNNQRIQAKDIVGALAGETVISGQAIGSIEIYDEHSFVDIPKEFVKDVLNGMKNKKVKGNRVAIDRADKEKAKKEKPKPRK